MQPDQPAFDPDAPAEGPGIYGLPHSPEDAAVILIPVPWDATASYAKGTARGPEAILRASRQVDLFDRETGRPYAGGIALLEESAEIRGWNEEARELARAHRQTEVNFLGALLNTRVQALAGEWLDRGRLLGVIGGEHSAPFGLMRALAERRPGFGVLQLDAHCDLREAYEGFRWSHASIFHNVLKEIPGVTRLVQVGIRDFAGREDELIRASAGRVRAFFDADLRRRQQDGETWTGLAREIVAALPEAVYLSFDIDGLDPSLCPHTGTPVPGGLAFAEAVSLLREIRRSGRRIIGFDLCEVAPDPGGPSEWDGNVGARLLYKMIGFARMEVA